jgi:hypothetical protein
MDEANLRAILGRLGIQPGKRNRRGWLEFKCPLAPWLHANGYDTRPSAAVKVSEEGVSSFVCKACHSHGRVSKLINQLAGFRGDDTIHPLMIDADRADAQAQTDAPPPDFEYTHQPDVLGDPLVPEAYAGLYPSACDVPDAVRYLRRRGLNRETTEKIGLLFDSRDRRILFPVFARGGGLYGYTGRSIDDEPFIMTANGPVPGPKVKDYYGLPKRHLILGEHWWAHGKPLLIVEGLFAYAHLIRIGVDEVANIGALLGSAMTPEKAERIIHADEPTYLLLDNDAGGDLGLFGTPTPEGHREQNGAVHLLAGHIPLHIPDWPEGKDDPDQLTREEVDHMLATTPVYHDGENPFDKRWELWA